MPYSFRNILLPTDFSEEAENALATAIVLCRKHNAVLHLMHVKENRYLVGEPGSETAMQSILQGIDNDTREHLYNIYESVIRTGIAVQIHMPTGVPYDEICRATDVMPIDLVVMGTHGISGKRSSFIGTTAYHVVRNSTKPVLTIPVSFKKEYFQYILFPVRAVPGIKEKYDYVLSLLNPTADRLHFDMVQHIIGQAVDEQTIEDINQSFMAYNNTGQFETYRGDDIAAYILSIASSGMTDLIAINTTLDYKNSQLFMNPYVQRMISNANVPVLSFRQAIDLPTQIKKNDDLRLVKKISSL